MGTRDVDVAKTESEEGVSVAAREKRNTQPDPGEDILDWDARIDTPPPRARGTIRVKLHCTGRSRPTPASDPWAE